MRKNDGFTLIEVMIVVAIIAILAALAIQVFPSYIVKSQVTAALADMHPGKTLVEAVIVEDRDAGVVTPEYLGLTRSTHCSAVSAELSPSGAGSIVCTLISSGTANGKDLVLRRSVDGVWTCDGGAFEVRYRPRGC
ncbi:MAG: pilin [Steroidobacteraceae bacterium]